MQGVHQASRSSGGPWGVGLPPHLRWEHMHLHLGPQSHFSTWPHCNMLLDNATCGCVHQSDKKSKLQKRVSPCAQALAQWHLGIAGLTTTAPRRSTPRASQPCRCKSQENHCDLFDTQAFPPKVGHKPALQRSLGCITYYRPEAMYTATGAREHRCRTELLTKQGPRCGLGDPASSCKRGLVMVTTSSARPHQHKL